MRSLKRTRDMMLRTACLLLLSLSFPVHAEEPTLARLSFWVPPERKVEFKAVYDEQVVPLLKQHGLVESSQRGRATVDSVFSRLFAVETPAAIAAQEQALEDDPAWQNVLRNLRTTFETAGADDAMRHRFGLYTAPAGAVKTVLAGPGFRQGLWQNRSGPHPLDSRAAGLRWTP